MIGLGLGATGTSVFETGSNFTDTRAMSFDGATDQVATATAGGITLFAGSGVSISLWAKDDAFHNEVKLFVNQYEDANNYWRVGFISGFPSIDYRVGSSTSRYKYWTSQNSATLSAYNHYCWVIDDSSSTNLANSAFYINGTAIGTFLTSTAATVTDNDGVLRLGMSTSGAYTHVDEVNEVAFFKNKLLSAAEVTAIYNSGTPFDLRDNNGDYVSSSSLEVYIRGEEQLGAGFIELVDDSTGNHDLGFIGAPTIDSTL